jgi:hypothetical protein
MRRGFLQGALAAKNTITAIKGQTPRAFLQGRGSWTWTLDKLETTAYDRAGTT